MSVPHEDLHLFVKDESVHVSGTFKERLIREAIRTTSPDTVLATISYGNTAYSMSRLLEAEPNRHGVAFMPPPREGRLLGPDTSGRSVSEIDLHHRLNRNLTIVPLPEWILDDAAVTVLAREAIGNTKAKIENITEGLTHPTYVEIVREACEQMGEVPDICLVPFGAGILCNEARDFLTPLGCDVVALSVSRANSSASMLYGPIWVPVDELSENGVAYSRHRSPDRCGVPRIPYPVIDVTESEVRAGIAFGGRYGISAEPSSAVGMGVLPRLEQLTANFRPRSTVLVINTGNAIAALHEESVIDSNGRALAGVDETVTKGSLS